MEGAKHLTKAILITEQRPGPHAIERLFGNSNICFLAECSEYFQRAFTERYRCEVGIAH